IGSALSLLLCIAAAVVGASGSGRSHGEEWNADSFQIALNCGNGLLRVFWVGDTSYVDKSGWHAGTVVDPRALRNDWTHKPNRAGFGLSVDRTVGPPGGAWNHSGRVTVVASLPLWLIVTVTALPPGWAAWRW